jgi:hypothetical protein
MVGHSADFEQDALLVPDETAEVFVQLGFQRIMDQWLAILRAEDDVVDEIGVGVGHGAFLEQCCPAGAFGEA